MKRLRIVSAEEYESFKAECDFFSFDDEYPGHNEPYKFGIITKMTSEQLESKYPRITAAMKPYTIFEESIKPIRDDFTRNEKKHEMRKIRSESLFEFDEKTESCHPELISSSFEDDIINNSLLYGALNQLSKIQQRRVCLYHFYGITCEEIANLEGVSHQAVNKSIQFAYEKLKGLLDAE